MQVFITPSSPSQPNCLVLVGGSGDTAKKFVPLVKELKKSIPNYSVCTFTLSSSVAPGNNLLETQAQELSEVFDILHREYNFNKIAVFCTSMGAYATVRLLNNPNFSKAISQVIFFDPADYYTSGSVNFADANSEITWSGYEDYLPDNETISNELVNYHGSATIHVVHLTLRSYGPNGYLESKYLDRGKDNIGGFPRLNTEMIKKYYTKIPLGNRGRYLELNNIPHGFLRDGNIKANIQRLVKTIQKLSSII